MIAICGCNSRKADEGDSGSKESSAKQTQDERFVRADSADENEARAKAIVTTLTQQLQTGLATLTSRVESATDDQEKAQIYSELNPVPEFIDGVMKAVEVFPTEAATFDAALTGLAYVKDAKRNALLDYLLDQWPQRLNHQKIASYLLKQVPSQEVESFLRKSAQSAPEGIGRAEALLAFKTYFDQKPLFSDMLRLSPDVASQLSAEQLEYIHTKRNDAQTAEVEKYLQEVIDSYSDLKYVNNGMSGGETFGEVATYELFELQNLNVGDVAPDIVGHDLDNTPFKLSDYRGKVVLLDFWGHWCPPCRRMYPHERHFVRELTGLPFALIGVNSDPDIETARRAVREDPLPWRNFWNGPEGTAGPISKQWNISDWPTFYLIDGQGVIRYKGILGDDIRTGIESLMAEMGHQIDLNPVEVATR